MAPSRQHIPRTPSIAPTAMPAFAPEERSPELANCVEDELVVDDELGAVMASPDVAAVAVAVEELLEVVEANM